MARVADTPSRPTPSRSFAFSYPNDFTGSATYVFRNEKMSAVNYRSTAIDFKQYGFTFGGPIIKDRLHFFIAPEWQKRSSAAAGSFIGSGGGASATGTTLNVSPDSIALVQSLVQSKRV